MIVKGRDEMQIALTKKLAEAMEVNTSSARGDENPLFSWTANWTKVWENRRAEDNGAGVGRCWREAGRRAVVGGLAGGCGWQVSE